MARTDKRSIIPDDLFRIALVSDPQPSPDGARIAYVVTRLDQAADDYRAALWLVPTNGGPPAQLTSGVARDTTPRWSPDGRFLLFASNRPPRPAPAGTSARDEPNVKHEAAKAKSGEEKPKNQLWLIPVDGGEARQLTWQEHGANSPVWSPDGRTIAFLAPTDQPRDDLPAPIADERIITSIRYRFDSRGFVDQRYVQLWTVALDGGEPTQITHGDADCSSPAWSPDSRLLAFSRGSASDEPRESTSLWVTPSAGGEARHLTSPDDVTAFGGFAVAWSPNGARIAFTGQRGPDAWGGLNTNLWTIAPDGTGLTNQTRAWDRSIGDAGMSDVVVAADDRPIWSPDGSAVYVLASDHGATHLHRVDLVSGAVTPVTSGPRRVTAARLTSDGRRIAYTAGDASHPFELFVADANGSNERQVTDHNRAFLDEVALSPAEEIRFPSQSDGAEIQGWVLRPPGFVEHGATYPLILEIHGGPHMMYGQAMFHEMQVLAARGYVVLLTNPRGSLGYGEAFAGSTRARWGEADMPDVMGGIDALLARGFIDPTRLGVTGGSYGGYLTNWLVGHTDRFAAAVTQRSVSTFSSFFGTSDIGFSFGEHEFGGVPWSDPELLRRHSPITYVERIMTPLLILHYENDLRCPMEQAEQLFVALKKLGREVAFIRIPGEDHNLTRAGKPSRRLAHLHHLLAWFDRWLAPPSTSDRALKEG